MTIETEREEDGRWLAEMLEIAGALTYGATREQGEDVPDLAGVFSVAA
jgi:predicted RNase H-like HicB family nuclease